MISALPNGYLEKRKILSCPRFGGRGDAASGEGRHTENLRKDSVLIEPEGVIGMTTKEKVLVFMECGISQAKIADMAQINRSTLSKWVSGQRDNINDETKEALEVALATMADRLNEAVYGETASPFQYDDIVLD